MKKGISNYLFILTFAVIFLWCHSAKATCYTNRNNASPQIQTVNIPDLIVQRDAAVGSTIGGFPTAQANSVLSCTPGGGFYYEMTMFSTLTNIPHVYQSNIPGVGVKISRADDTLFFESPASFISNSIQQLWSFSARYITLIKTGNITSGRFNSGLLGRIYGDGDRVTAVGYNVPAFAVKQVACSITTSNLIFPIGNVLVSKFGNSIGTLPAGGQNTQNLGLSCDAGANINVMLQGTQNPDVSTTSVLALTGQGNSDVATGVGVQLLYNGAPLVLNNRIVLKSSTGGQETFPITARYYQTKTSVSTGKANASATLDLTYQ